MCKKTIALFCVFLVVLAGFAACKKRSPYGAVIVDQQGMEHVIMTDANGVTVIDENGNLVEVMTNSADKKPIAAPTENGTVSPAQAGSYETHTVTFPGVVENGETVEDAFCSVTLPEGWEQIGNNYLILHHVETDAKVMLYTDIGGTATGAIRKLTEEVEALDPQGGYTQSDVDIGGITATRTQYELGEMTITVYLLVTGNGKVCRINCTVETDKRDAANVESLVQQIRFK